MMSRADHPIMIALCIMSGASLIGACSENTREPSSTASAPHADAPGLAVEIVAPITNLDAEASACRAGYGDCNRNPGDGCETPLSTLEHCGACGNGCRLGDVASREECRESAGAFVCMTECAAPKVICGTACVDVAGDARNCGACGRACGGSAACVARVCQPEIIATDLGQPTSLVQDAFGLAVVDAAGGRVLELDPQGATLNARTGASPSNLVLVGDTLYWTEANTILRRKRLSAASPASVTTTYGTVHRLVTDGAWLFWVETWPSDSELQAYDLSTRRRATFPRFYTSSLFVYGAFANTVFTYRVPYNSAGAIHSVFDATTNQGTVFDPEGGFGGSEGCVVDDKLYYVSSRYDVRSVSVITPQPASTLFDTTLPDSVRHLSCDAAQSTLYLVMVTGGVWSVKRYPLPAGPPTDVANASAEISALVRRGAYLYWTLPGDGAIARVRL